MSEQLSIGAVMALPAHLTDPFESFWKAYPKRPNHSKAEARTAFLKALRKASIAQILDGLSRYEFSEDPRMRPMAATWLNKCRWECVNDDLASDPYGLAEWLANLPRTAGLSASVYAVEDLRPILVAAKLPPSWRGSLDVLDAWMRDGYEPDSCAQVIASAVEEFGTRKSLDPFDKRVRYRASRILLNH